jgi:hypothetical protein
LIDLLKNSRKQHWMKALQWLYYTGVFGALPFWGVALLLWFFSQRVGADLLTRDAELAVYSAGLLASAIPIMKKETQGLSFRRPGWFLDLAMLLVVICALVFAAVTLVDRTTPAAAGTLNKWFINDARILLISVVLAGVSLALCFLTELTEAIVSDTDLRQIHAQEIDTLGDRLREKRGTNEQR